MWIPAVVAALVVMVAGAYIVSRSRYYGRMFSEANFRAFHSGLSHAIKIAKGKGADSKPSLDDGSAFVTDAGLAVGITCATDEDGSQTIHISMSQPGWHTTHGVCSRFGFFAVAMLRENKAELVPFFTESGVHHLVFRCQSQHLKVQDFDDAHSVYLAEYRPIPFEYQKIESEPSLAADG